MPVLHHLKYYTDLVRETLSIAVVLVQSQRSCTAHDIFDLLGQTSISVVANFARCEA